MADDQFARPDYTRAVFEHELLSHYDWLYGFARTLTRSAHDAHDLVQTTCLLALARIEKYDPSYKLRSWLGTMMFRANIDRYRKESRLSFKNPLLFEEGLGGSESHEATIDAMRDFHRIACLVLALPEEQRDTVVAQHYLDFSHRELARIFKVPLGTVKGRIREGVRKIRAGLGGEVPLPSKLTVRNVRERSPYFPIAEAVRHLYLQVTT